MQRTAYLQRLFAHLTNKCSLYSAPDIFCYAVCLGGSYHTLLAFVLRINHAPRTLSGEPLDNWLSTHRIVALVVKSTTAFLSALTKFTCTWRDSLTIRYQPLTSKRRTNCPFKGGPRRSTPAQFDYLCSTNYEVYEVDLCESHTSHLLAIAPQKIGVAGFSSATLHRRICQGFIYRAGWADGGASEIRTRNPLLAGQVPYHSAISP